jgi:predicted dehydrogenase
VRPEHAAFSTVGAIAMHGVRRAEPQLGETAAVIGLGLVGQLVVRLLVAAGVRVVGLDVIGDRCKRAEQAGAVFCAPPDGEGMAATAQALAEITGGRGADHVFLAAGGSSNGPVEAAVQLARDRARVVDIGKTRLDLPWNAYYDKELDVRFSRSYGPGRYDDRYELEGIDYPAGYVRWTERRNIECFLDLLAHQEIEVETLVTGTFPVAEASTVYADLASGAVPAVGVLLEYPAPAADGPSRTSSWAVPAVRPAAPRGADSGALAAGFIGAGNYASSMLLPHLARMDAVRLAHVATNRSLSAANAQRRFGFSATSTSADAVLTDETLDAIFIVTRHHTHADLVCRALETGKAVFVEKPLALTREELDRVVEVVEKTGNDRLMVGFNRRFAPLLGQLKSRFGPPGGGSVTRYLVNAGRLDADSWYRHEELEGSRFLGEGGHFIDTAGWWADSLPEEVWAARGPEHDDVQATIRLRNGSVAAITYFTEGNSRYPKETLDTAADGRSARLDNFQTAALWAGRRRSTMRSRGGPDKGQQRELSLFAEAIRTGGPMPIPLESLVATTSATIAVAEEPGQRPYRSGCERCRRCLPAGLVRCAEPPGCHRPRRPGGPATKPSSWPGHDRQLRRGQLSPILSPPRSGAAKVHRRAAARVHGRGQVPDGGPGRRAGRRGPAACGANGRCSASARTDLVARLTGSAIPSPAAGPHRTATPSGSTSAPRRRSAT